MVCFQIDLVCKEGSEGEGVKISPHIDYNCHDTMMAEMAELVEAYNNNETNTTYSTSTTSPISDGKGIFTVSMDKENI